MKGADENIQAASSEGKRGQGKYGAVRTFRRSLWRRLELPILSKHERRSIEFDALGSLNDIPTENMPRHEAMVGRHRIGTDQ